MKVQRMTSKYSPKVRDLGGLDGSEVVVGIGGDDAQSRTGDLLVRSEMLYPSELRRHAVILPFVEVDCHD